MTAFKALIATSFCLSLNAIEPSENGFLVDPQDNFVQVIEYINENEPSAQELHLNVKMTDQGMTVKPCPRGAKEAYRDYHSAVTKEEKKKVRYIVKTLGFGSLAELATERSDLKKAGKQINHLHPLRFLMTVFTDEELKAGVHAIRGRMVGWIWSEFIDGLSKSLSEESARQNMKPEFIQDFANTVQIDMNLILPSIQQKNWEGFVNVLIDHIPRKNNPNRYDN